MEFLALVLSGLLYGTLSPRHVIGACFRADGVSEREIERLCADLYGFAWQGCQNMDCYLMCTENFMAECLPYDETFFIDPIVFRVTMRVRCYDDEYYGMAAYFCEKEWVCPQEDIDKMVSLYDEASTLYYSGQYTHAMETYCSAYTLDKGCFAHNASGFYCNETLADYVDDFVRMTLSYSRCGDPQDSPVFVRFGEEPVCAKITGDNRTVAETSTTMQTPMEQLRCSDIDERLYQANCPFNISDDVLDAQYAVQNCTNLACREECYDRIVGDCDKYNRSLSKTRHRSMLRLICNANESGLLQEIPQYHQNCERAYVVGTYIYIMNKSSENHTEYCRMMEGLRKTEFYAWTRGCPDAVAEYIRLYTITFYDICKPETSMLNETFDDDKYTCANAAQRKQITINIIYLDVLMSCFLFWVFRMRSPGELEI